MNMSLSENLFAVRARIHAACVASGRDPASVQLLAVTKKVPAAWLRQTVALGQQRFGESYVQEALPKLDALADLALEWHHIGPIQSNKTADVAARFAWAHGVDRLKIAQRLSEQRPVHLPPLNVCVQVNVSGEASKSGCAPDETLALATAIAALPRLKLRGLMCLPAPLATTADAQAPFRLLRELRDQINSTGLTLDTLSMGMSDDLEPAVAEGATLLRVGSAIFGERTS